MAYPDLRAFLEGLGDDVIRVDAPLNPRFEVAALLAEMQASGRAVVCDNIKGYPGRRVAGNLLASRRLAARALGADEGKLVDTYVARSAQRVPPVRATAAPVHAVVHRAPCDVAALLPLLTHYEKDAAPFLTILEEAGGVLTDWGGARTAFGGAAIATNARLADEVRALLRGDGR